MKPAAVYLQNMAPNTNAAVGRTIRIPDFSIAVDVFAGGGGTIQSSLRESLDGKSADAIESLLLALACSGVDLSTPACVHAINTAVDAIANHPDAAD